MTLQISGPRNHHSGTISGPRNLHYDIENLYADIHNYNWMLSAARSNLAGISTDIREVKFVHKHSQFFSLIHTPLRTEPHWHRKYYSRSLAGPAGRQGTDLHYTGCCTLVLTMGSYRKHALSKLSLAPAG